MYLVPDYASSLDFVGAYGLLLIDISLTCCWFFSFALIRAEQLTPLLSLLLHKVLWCVVLSTAFKTTGSVISQSNWKHLCKHVNL